MANAPHAKVVRFGVYELDLAARQLRKNGARIKLQEQPFRILQILVERSGEVVTRDELREKLWSADTFVEFDQSLNTAVQKIRQALRDSAESPRFIETVPRQGYRFLAPVTTNEDPAPLRRRAALVVDRRVSLAGTALLVAAVIVVAYTLRQGSTTILRTEDFVQEPLTGYSGDEQGPSFSPDGSQVAFSWAQGTDGNSDIWVVVPGTGSPRQITHHPDPEVSPAWSPDGASVAFLRLPRDSSRIEIWSASALGGAERKLGEILWPIQLPHVLPYGSLLAWSPDGKWLALGGQEKTGGPLRLQILSLETLQTRWLTTPEATLTGDLMPSFSPDGRAIAFVRRTGVGAGHALYVLRLSSDYEPVGQPERIADSMLSAWSPVWRRDGRTVLYLGQRVRQEGIWEVTAWSQEEPRLVWPEQGARSLAIGRRPRDGNLVVALDFSDEESDVWAVTIRGPDAGQERPIVATPRREGLAQYSRRGDKIVYISDSDTSADLWIADSDGSHRQRLTRLGAPMVSWPNWSPDGKSVVFYSRLEGQGEICVVEVESGAFRLVSPHPADDAVPIWPDEHAIYFCSRRGGDWAIWRASPEGGEAVPVSDAHAGRPQADPAGRFLYYYRFPEWEIWRRPLLHGEPAGPEELVVPVPDRPDTFIKMIFPVEGGVYFVQYGVLRFFDLQRGEIHDLVEIEGVATSLSPDQTTLLYTKHGGRGHDLFLLTDRSLQSDDE